MKGRIGQRGWYDRIPGALGEAMAEWRRADRPRTTASIERVPHARTPTTSSSRWARSPTPRSTSSTISAPRATRSAACGDLVPAVPRRGSSSQALRHAARGRRRRAHRRAAAASGNPLTREIKAALCRRWPQTARADPAGRLGLGRPRLARRRGRRPRSPSSTGCATGRACVERRTPCSASATRSPSSAPTSTCGRAGAYSMRGHSIGGFGSVTDEQAARDARRRAVRPVRAGVSALRLREEGPADDLLPDHRRRSRIRQHGELDRVELVPLHDVAAFGQGDPLAGLVDGGALFIQSAADRPGGDLGLDPGRCARGDHRPAASASSALDTAALAGATRRAPDLHVRMQGVALVGVFLRVAPFAARCRPGPRRAAGRRPSARSGGSSASAAGAVVEANLAIIASGLRRPDRRQRRHRAPGSGRAALGRSRPMTSHASTNLTVGRRVMTLRADRRSASTRR